jgi:hypothetical protein
VIDFPNKRILIGGRFMPVGRDAFLSMFAGDESEHLGILCVHIPPWWELDESATVDAVDQPRRLPIRKPHVDRQVLYGDALLNDLAARVLTVVQSDEWKNSQASEQEQDRYPFTVQVHRDWLMTPREDLGGRIPRELLHGAHEWSGKVTWGQRHRFDDGEPIVAAPDDWPGFDTAPMGPEEMCIYFDLCRELINASWTWCQENQKWANASQEHSLRQLVEFLRQFKDDWMNGPSEDGASPNFVIQCDRRRVPRGAGVAIEGMDERQVETHIDDCDCPICEMMADGVFGTAFTGIDGHHLELDDEFAFSMAETVEEWKKKQEEYANMGDEMEFNRLEHENPDETDDPFASAWTGINTDVAIPGDSRGELQMAFMVAEIVSVLHGHDASKEEIKALNKCFADYRRSEDSERQQTAIAFKAILQSTAERFPSLVSKSADLQSRIEETERNLANDDNESSDYH